MELIGFLLLTFIFNKKIDCLNIPTESVENYTFSYEKDELKTDYSNFVVEEDPEGLGSAKNPIKLNNGLNVDVYCILINDTIVFNLSGFSIVDDKPSIFTITIGDEVVTFVLNKVMILDIDKISMDIYINGKKAITTDNFMMNDSLTVTINKNGSITGEKLFPLKDTVPSLGTLPTINGDNVVHMKINGSEFSNATMNLTFETTVGKLVDKKPLNGDPSTKPVANSSAGNFFSRLSDPKIIAGIVCGIAVVIASAIIVTCCLWPVCPIYQKFRNKDDKIVVSQFENATENSEAIFTFFDRKGLPLDPARIECFKIVDPMVEEYVKLDNELDELITKYANATDLAEITSLSNQFIEKFKKGLALFREMSTLFFEDWLRNPNYTIDMGKFHPYSYITNKNIEEMIPIENINSEVKEKQASSKK